MKTKRGDDYLLEQTTKAINELVDLDKKSKLKKFYNYYSRIRDKDQFKYLKDKFGINTPTSVHFTPFLRSHYDSIVGEYMTKIHSPSVSCKDKTTIDKMFNELKLKIASNTINKLQPLLNSVVYSSLYGDGKKKLKDEYIQQLIDETKEFTKSGFISQYEESAQNVLSYFEQSSDFDYIEKLRKLHLDLLIAGTNYFRVKRSSANTSIILEYISPLNYFPEVKPGMEYNNECRRSVLVKYMSKSEVIAKYGDLLKEKDLKIINESEEFNGSINGDRLITSILKNINHTGEESEEIIENTEELVSKYHYLTIYEVEWIDFKEFDGKYIEQRYKTIRIGESINILLGEDKDLIRDLNNPEKCKLSINGVRYKNENDLDYSMVEATMDIQDQYDVLQFLKMNIIQNSGAAGDFVDLAFLPKMLGKTPMKRVERYLNLKNQGIALIDSTSDVAGGMTMPNTIFNGYDNTLKAQALQALQLAIEDTQQQAMNITGVSRERLNGIQARDAVKNVEVGMQQSYIITKQYTHKMFCLMRDIWMDTLNVAKKVFKNGLTGKLVLGNKNVIFTALPEYFTLTNYDIHIVDPEKAEKEKSELHELALELIKGGMADVEIITFITTSRNATELNRKINQSIAKKKKENDQLQKAMQQIEEMKKQLTEGSKQLKTSQKEVEKLKKEDLAFEKEKFELEKQKLAFEQKLALRKQESDEKLNDKKIEQEQGRTKLQIAQIFDNNPNNDKIRQ